jgi:prevent-host-death family protein
MRRVGVAEAKRRFSEMLARVAYAGEWVVITKRGKPVAALVGVQDAVSAEGTGTRPQESQGLIGTAGSLADWEGLEAVMATVVRQRRQSRGRSVRPA